MDHKDPARVNGSLNARVAVNRTFAPIAASVAAAVVRPTGPDQNRGTAAALLH